MTRKQIFSVGTMWLGMITFDIVVYILSRDSDSHIPAVLVFLFTMVGCYSIGHLEHKWKRDKEMAHIVAERLMGKSHHSHTPDPQANTAQYANAFGSAQQSGASLQSSHLSGMLGNVGVAPSLRKNTFKGTN